MKNTTQIDLLFIPTKFIFTVGRKAYKKYMINFNEVLTTGAVTSEIIDGSYHEIVVGVDPEKCFDIYSQKALITHELSHAVTMIMNRHGFTCDEFRSYLLQHLHQGCMRYYDKVNNDR